MYASGTMSKKLTGQGDIQGCVAVETLQDLRETHLKGGIPPCKVTSCRGQSVVYACAMQTVQVFIAGPLDATGTADVEARRDGELLATVKTSGNHQCTDTPSIAI